MLLEPLCFAISEPGGPARRLVVTVHRNGSASIANDGPGVPTDVDPRFGKPLLDVLMTMLFACRNLKSTVRRGVSVSFCGTRGRAAQRVERLAQRRDQRMALKIRAFRTAH